MGYWLSLKSSRTSVDELVLINDWSATGYIRESGGDWGFVDNQGIFSGSIDTDGSSKVGERVENRTLTFPILIDGTTPATVQTRWDALADMVSELRNYKGKVRFRPSTATYGVDFEIEHARLENDYWPKLAELGAARRLNLVLTVRPYALMDAMDIEDDFATDSLGTGGRYNNGGADWARDAGAAGDLVITGGVLDAAANLSTEQRLYHTGAPHTYGDVQVTARYVPGATISSFKGGVIVKRVDASNYVEVYVDDTGAASRLRIDKVIAGSRTNMASTNLASRIADNAAFWVAGRVEHNQVFAEHWTAGNYPQAGYTPTTSTSDTFDTTEAALFGLTVTTTRPGLVFTPQHTSAKCENWRVQAFCYKHGNFPQRIDLNGEIPGNTDALVDFTWGQLTGVDTYMMLGWLPTPDATSLLAGVTADSETSRWSQSAVAGVIGAGTSASGAVTDGYWGGEHLQIVTPATSDTGAARPIYRRFTKGVTYTFTAYLKSAANTTLTRLKLGVSGDIATGTSVALSTTWTQHTVSWTPTADVELAYVAIGVAAATLTTIRADAMCLSEAHRIPEQLDRDISPYVPFAHGEAPLGIIDSSNAVTSTPTASGDAKAGFYTPFTSGLGEVAGHVVVDALRGETEYVAAWARLYLPSGVTGFTLVPSFDGTTAATGVFSLEFGTSGRTIAAPSSGNRWRTVFLGTFPLSNGSGGVVRNLFLSPTFGGTAPGFDYIILLPADKSATSQFGITGAAAVPFAASGGHRVRHSLDVYLSQNSRRSSRRSSLVGSSIKVPPGSASFVVAPTDYLVDRTDSNAGTQTLNYTGTAQFSVQPRVLMGAG